MVDYDVIVVGAGLGGSIASAYLAQAGLKTIVFDRADVGGRYEGFKRDGFKLDKHIHVLIWDISLNEGLGWWAKAARETKAKLKWESMPLNAIWLNGEEVLLPFCSCGDAFVDFMEKMSGGSFPPESRSNLANVFDAAMNIPVEDARSDRFDQRPAIEWLKEITDDPIVEMLLRHFVAMTVVVKDEIALEIGSINSLIGVLRLFGGRVLFAKLRGEPAEAMPKAFCDVATGHGGQVLTHHTVKNVIVENGKAKGVVVVDRQGVEETYRAKYVVNTACYPEMRKLLGANIPKHIDDIITDLYKSDTVALDVHLGLKKKVLPNLSSQLMLVTDQMEYDGVIATFTNLDPAWAPPGKQAINAELFLSQTEYKTKTVEEWFEHMKEGVFKRWPEVKPEVEWVESFIVPSASVHQSTHAVKRLPLESGIDGLYFAGDCTVGEGVVSERAAYSARKVAKMIISREGKG